MHDKNTTIETMIDAHWDVLFKEICSMHDDLYDLVIEYKEGTTGKTIRRSWQDRENMLRERKD